MQRVEALGFDSLWTGDHVSFHTPLYESLTLLASYASVTRRVAPRHRRLPAGPAPAGRRREGHLDARRAVGRPARSSGWGWAARTRRSSRPAAFPTGSAGARVTEGIEAVRTLWRDTPATFKGRFTAFEGVSSIPKPVQQGGPADLDRRALGRRPRAAPGVRATAGCPTSSSPERYKAEPGEDSRGGRRGRGRPIEASSPRIWRSSRWGATTSGASGRGCERLSRRYAQDFGPLAEKYGIIGTARAVRRAHRALHRAAGATTSS